MLGTLNMASLCLWIIHVELMSFFFFRQELQQEG